MTLPSSRLILRPRNQCNLPLSSMLNGASSAFLISELTVMLHDATMMSSTQNKMKVWTSVSDLANNQGSFLPLVDHCLSRNIDSSLYQLFAACFKNKLIYSVDIVFFLVVMDIVMEPTNFPSSALGSSLLTSLSRFIMKTVQPKTDLLIESLNYITRNSSAGQFFLLVSQPSS